MSSVALCFYHSPCNDGASAAAVVSKRIHEIEPETDVEFHPIGFTVGWDDPVPEAELRVLGHEKRPVTSIYIVDISLSPVKYNQILDYLRKVGRIGESKPKTVCIDHHRTALDNIDALTSYCDETMIEIGPGLSGATLAWNYFNRFAEQAEPIPLLLQYVADQDIWEWKLNSSREINSALNRLDGKAESMVKELDWSLRDNATWLRTRLQQGKAVISVVDSQLKKSYTRVFDYLTESGTEFRIVNATENASELGNMLCEESKHSPAVIVMIYSIQRNWSVKCSVRSIPGGKIVAREIAERFRGGGHDHAAGCRFENVLEFDKALEALLGVDVKLINHQE